MRLLIGLVIAAVLTVTGVAVALPGTKTSKDRAKWKALVHWSASCEQDWQVTKPSYSGIQTWKAPNGGTLVSVLCDLGAYQGTQMLYLLSASGTPSKALKFHIYEDPGSGKPTAKHETRLLGNLSYSTKTRTLSIVDKFRGVGDCGIASKFKLSGGRFVPSSTRAKTACDGKPPYDPDKWPKLKTLGP